MPVRDSLHKTVVEALKADGWTITHDPLRVTIGVRDLFVDLGIEQESLGAEKNGIRLALEIKSFLNYSVIQDLAEALGKFLIYRIVLKEMRSDRLLYLAVSLETFKGIFQERLGRLLIRRHKLKLMVFDEPSRRVVTWTPLPAIDKLSGT